MMKLDLTIWILMIAIYAYNIMLLFVNGVNMTTAIMGWVCAILLALGNIVGIIMAYRHRKLIENLKKQQHDEIMNKLLRGESNENKDID